MVGINESSPSHSQESVPPAKWVAVSDIQTDETVESLDDMTKDEIQNIDGEKNNFAQTREQVEQDVKLSNSGLADSSTAASESTDQEKVENLYAGRWHRTTHYLKISRKDTALSLKKKTPSAVYTVEASPGPIGLKLLNDASEMCFIATVMEDSPLYGKVHQGDRIIEVNEKDVSAMSSSDLEDLISRKEDKKRIFTLFSLSKIMPPESVTSVSSGNSNRMSLTRKGRSSSRSTRRLGLFSSGKKRSTMKSQIVSRTTSPEEIQQVKELYTNGRNLMKKNDFDKAKEVFMKILEIDQSAVHDVFNAIGNAHYEEGNFDLAIRGYTVAMKHLEKKLDVGIDIERSAVMCSKGKAYLKLNENEEALECFQLAVEAAKTNAFRKEAKIQESNAYMNIGRVYYLMKQFDLSLQFYLSAFRSKIEVYGIDHLQCAIARHCIGLALAKKGRANEALRVYRSLLENEIYSKSQSVHLAKLLLDISEIYISNGYSKREQSHVYCMYASDIFNKNCVPETHQYSCQLRRLLSKI